MKTVIAIMNRSLPLTSDFRLSVVQPPYSPLTIAGIGLGPRRLPAISVWQYRQRGGKRLREPEMHFEVEWRSGEVAELYPYSWHSEYAELDEVAVACLGTEPDGRLLICTDGRMVADQRAFALQWDRELAAQGFEQAYYRAELFTPPSYRAHA